MKHRKTRPSDSQQPWEISRWNKTFPRFKNSFISTQLRDSLRLIPLVFGTQPRIDETSEDRDYFEPIFDLITSFKT